MINLAHISERDASEGYDGPVPVLQRRWEFDQLLKLYREQAPRRTLEVGTYHGGTLYHWLTNAPAGARVVSVDRPPPGVVQDEIFRRWAPPRVDLRLLRGDSADPEIVSAAARFGPFDFIFLDAGHATHEIRADWRAYSAMTAPGGIIALHDILPGRNGQAWIEVAQVWKEIQRDGYLTQEIVASEDVDWGGIGVVFL